MIKLKTKALQESIQESDLTKIKNILHTLTNKLQDKTYTSEASTKLKKRLDLTLEILEKLPQTPSKAKAFGIKNLSVELPKLRNLIDEIIETISNVPENIKQIISIISNKILYLTETEADLYSTALKTLTTDDVKVIETNLNLYNAACPDKLYESGAIIDLKFVTKLASIIKDIESKTTTVKTNLAAIQETITTKIAAKLKTSGDKASAALVTDAEKKAKQALDTANTANSIDWAKKFRETKPENIKEFWNEYWKTEWNDPEGRLDEILGASFKEDTMKLGFSQFDNPLILFTRKFLIPTLFPKLDNDAVRHSAYSRISHVYTEDKNLSQKDLIGDSKLGEFNIIFCKDLYLKDFTEFRSYIEIQNSIKTDFINTNFNPDIADLLVKKYGETGGLKNYILDVLYSNGQDNPFVKAEGERLENVLEGKLRNLEGTNGIKNLVRISLKEREGKKTEATADNIKNLVTSKTEGGKLIQLIIIKYSTSTSVNIIDSIYAKYPDIKTLKYSTADLWDKNLLAKLDKLNVSPKNIITIIDAIAEKAGIESIESKNQQQQ